VIFYKRAADKEVEYYRQDEADELGLQYIPWRSAITEGQWILTDDNYVLKTTKVKALPETRHHKTRIRYRVYTDLCWRYPHRKQPMEIERHMEVCRYGMIPNTWWEEYQAECPALNRLLAKAIILGELPFNKCRKYTREQSEVFGRIANKLSDHLSGYDIRRYYNADEVRMGLQDEIRKMALEKGCTLEEVFDLYNEAKTLARKGGNIKGLIMVGDRYAGIIGMTSKTVTTGPEKQLPIADEDPLFQKVISDNDNG
jgi:hypothetical protein